MNLLSKLQLLGNSCANKAVVPIMSGRCGMAGDRGFIIRQLPKQQPMQPPKKSLRSNMMPTTPSGKTCEMAMFDAVGKNISNGCMASACATVLQTILFLDTSAG